MITRRHLWATRNGRGKTQGVHAAGIERGAQIPAQAEQFLRWGLLGGTQGVSGAAGDGIHAGVSWKHTRGAMLLH